MPENEQLQELWDDVRQALRSGDTINRALWEAADAAIPLTIDDDTFVVGFAPADMRHSSYIETSTNKNRIQEILQAKTGRRLEVRCIEGETVEAWERLKEREKQRKQRTEEQFQKQKRHSEAAETWDELANELQDMFASTEHRGEPKTQARMLVRALPKVLNAEQKARQQSADAERLNEQSLNRIFTRLSTVCGIPEAQVALEYMRYRSAHGDRQ